MPRVKFITDNKVIEVEAGTTILQAARKAGIAIESPCNEIGTCGKCKVKLDDNSLVNIQGDCMHSLSEEEKNKGYVLSCQAGITGDISVVTDNFQRNRTLKILSHGESFDIILESFIKKRFFESENTTGIYAGEKIIGYEKGDTVMQNYGVVVDIGTTTLVADLVDLSDGSELASASSLNPQAIYAQDVLSRIKLASEEAGLKVMNSELIKVLNGMIAELSAVTGINTDNIYEVVFSGNTCMLHLAANINPYSLGKFPYLPEISGGSHLHAQELGLAISEFGLIYLPSIISSYVGADITSGVLAAQLYKKDGITLFVDIGTNGEMVIGFDGRLSATSTAAGPAFEGMNIACGMRAGAGAIEYFNIEDNENISMRIIEDTEAVGICGSGLLDIVGELVSHGIIDRNGKFIKPETEGVLPSLRERLIIKDGKIVFKLTEAVYLSQKDIRQVQLAKGAVRAGIEFLMDNKGVQASDVDKVLIAGSFGYHLRAKSLINIGLLPQDFEGKIDFIGNTSKSGGRAFLLNSEYRKQMEKIVKDVEVIELANYKDFDKVFVKCLGF